MDDAAAARIEQDFPAWMVLRGIPGGRCHAKRPGANGQEHTLVSGEDETDLRDQIIRAEGKLDRAARAARERRDPGPETPREGP